MNTSKTYDMGQLAKEFEGEDFTKPPVTYEFSSGKVFTEQPNTGVYEVIPE